MTNVMLRRDLLTLPALAAGRALGAPFKEVRVGAHIWIFAAKQPRYDATPVLEDVFRQYSGAGLDGVELMHQVLLHDDAVDRVAELSQRYKLPVIGTSFEAPMWNRQEHVKIANDVETLVGRLAALKGKTLGLSVGDAGRRKTPRELDAQADMLRQIQQIAKEKKVRPNLHNHVYEVKDGEYDLQHTLERVEGIALGPDVGWLYRAGINPVEFVTRYQDRIVFLHLRDETKDHKWPDALGEGAIDFAAIGKTLHQMKFSGDLVIELAHEPGFMPVRTYGESVRASREYVRRVMRY
jgi:sugar phosphate isomerase/epimerase